MATQPAALSQPKTSEAGARGDALAPWYPGGSQPGTTPGGEINGYEIEPLVLSSRR